MITKINTVGKMCQLEKLVTDRKVGDSQKNEHSWKMCHSKKNESQLEIYTP